VASCCECGDEPSGSCATELVRVDKPLDDNDEKMLPVKVVVDNGILCSVYDNLFRETLRWWIQTSCEVQPILTKN
jgi:hypothetical protein